MALLPWIKHTGLLRTKAWNITDVPSQEGVPKTCSSFWWQWQRIWASQWQPPSKLHFLSGSQSSGPPTLPEHFVIWQPHKSGTQFGDCINCPGWCCAMNSFTYRPKLYLLTEWLFHLLKWFSTGGTVSSWEYSVKPTDISGYHTLVGGMVSKGATDIQWLEARGAAVPNTGTALPPTAKNYLAQNVHTDSTEKPWHRIHQTDNK